MSGREADGSGMQADKEVPSNRRQRLSESGRARSAALKHGVEVQEVELHIIQTA